MSPLTPEDIGILAEWWMKQGATLATKYLPPLGFCLWENDEMMVASFLCEMELEGGKGGIISWTIVNPDHMASALRVSDQLLKDIISYSKEEGFIALSCTSNSRLLAKTYKDNGFEIAHDSTTQYILT